MKICNNHLDTRPTPLIFTFAFPSCEYWCPYCGYKSGMFGAGTQIEETPELVQREKDDWENAKPFLIAIGRRSCVSTLFEGKQVAPEDLPQSEKDNDKKIIAEWKYHYQR